MPSLPRAAAWRSARHEAVEHQVDLHCDHARRVEAAIQIRAGAHRMLVQHQEQHRRHQGMHHVVDRHRAELAAVDATLHHPADHAFGRQHHFVEVELRDVGEVANFRNDQLADARGAGLADAAPPLGHQVGQQLGRRPVEAAHDVLALGDLLRDVLADHRLQQFFLAGVVEVEGALGDAGARRHLLRARRREALLDEQIEGGVEQLLRARFLAPLAGGGEGVGSS
ncbi:hypothetical protein X551_02895 [Methylibium sp. T29]|nr:hypothetical protein X551_02895 [Methylibium sp. T29]